MDLAIIGGGPAGTAAALEARRRGLGVTIWERDRFPRDKVCGEFLSAESLPLLEEKIPAALARGAIIRRSEFISPRGRVYSFSLPRPGRGLSRRMLDEALWRAATLAGAVTREGEFVRRLRKLDGGKSAPAQAISGVPHWELESSAEVARRARAVIIACGRWWMLESFPSPARAGKMNGAAPWLGAKAHFEGVAPRDAVEMYFFPGGYCGLAPIEGGTYNACCLVHRSLVRNAGAGGLCDFAGWLRKVARTPALESRLRGATQAGETVATAPLCPARRPAEHDGALLVGDAAGFLDPFTGDGISMALHSGRLAVEGLTRAWSSDKAVGEKNSCEYRRRLGRAVRRSYTVAGLVRALVCAPSGVQDSVARALPWLGARLLAATRWRESSVQ